MASVRRHRGAVRVDLAEAEVALLAGLAGQVRRLLTDGLHADQPDNEADPLQALIGIRGSDTTTPDDPVLARLLPDAYRDDDAAAGEYRRLMDADLRLQKAAALQCLLEDLDSGGVVRSGDLRIELTDANAERWLYGLNDIRLALGTTLGVTEDLDIAEELTEPESPRAMGLGIYDWLTWLQDAMIGAIS